MKRPPEMGIDELWDKYLRALADTDNMRKKHAVELRKAREEGVESAVLEMLPIVDNLERGNQAAQAVKGRGGINRLREGFEVVTRHAHSTLGNIGVNPFDCEHQKFDPQRMNAIARQPTDGEPGLVFAEIERGYTIRDRLLRPAKVAVSEALFLEQENDNA